jgi:hypothetical protein
MPGVGGMEGGMAGGFLAGGGMAGHVEKVGGRWIHSSKGWRERCVDG